jgi:hypothetical protein
MSLQLFEFTLDRADPLGTAALVEHIVKNTDAVGAEPADIQVTAGHGQVFAVIDTATDRVTADLRARFATIVLAASGIRLTGPHAVRLVGADPRRPESADRPADYLAEWEFPPGLDMDTYLARKQAKSAGYAQVPQVRFLRTYVREDMEKCVCLYRAPDEQSVRAARRAVDTPIDRLHRLAGQGEP